MPEWLGFEKNKSISEAENRSEQKTIQTGRHTAALSKQQWETAMLEVNGRKVTLQYPNLASGEITTDYKLKPSRIQLQDGLTIEPGKKDGQVSAYRNGKRNVMDMVFTVLKGKVEYAPANLKKAKAKGEIASTNILFSKKILEESRGEPEVSDYTEISTYFKKPLILKPIKGFELELGESEYEMREDAAEPSLKFWRSKLLYKGQNVTADFVTESNSDGLHIMGKYAVALDAQKLGKAAPRGENGQIQAIDLVMDRSGARLDLHADQAAEQVQEQNQEQAVVVQHADIPEKPAPVEEEETTARSNELRVGSSTFRFVDPNWEDDRIVSAQSAVCVCNGDEMQLEDVTVDAANGVKARVVKCIVEGYQTTLYNAVFQEGGARIRYDSAQVMSVLKFGQNRENQEENDAGEAKSFFTFTLGKGEVVYGSFLGGGRALELAGQSAGVEAEFGGVKNRRRVKEIGQDIFTEDGFAQLEDATFDFQEGSGKKSEIKGKGKVKFLGIPYSIFLEDGQEITGVTEEQEEDMPSAKFTVSPEGDLDAEIDDDAELLLNSAEEVSSLRLIGVAIKDGRVTAEAIRLDQGKEYENDLDDITEKEKAKKLFGFSFKASKANVAKLNNDNKLDAHGIHANAVDAYLGKFGVSNFLGFMDAEGDYLDGMLKVSFTKEKEKDNALAKIFEEVKEGITDDGLKIPLFGPLSFTIKISPSVKIGASWSAEMNRGKSFGEKKKPGDPPMELKADAEVKVTAGLSIDAGLAVGVPYIANASVALSTELGAELGATLAASTALEEENEKLVQGEDLEISGEIKAAFSAALSLVGDVKVLIWKQQVFKLELLKKEIELAFSGTAAKAKNTPGIKEGWNFKEFGFSADVFGKKVIAAIKEKDAAQPTLQEDLKVSKEAAENISGEAQNAWAVLQELKEKRELSKDRAYIITEDEQKKLDEQIHDMTESVLDKMKAYERALIQYRALSQRNEDQAQKDVENARKEQYEYMEKDAVRQITMRNTQAGGFDFKNYHPEKIEEGASNKEKKAAENSNADKRKMASIDFAAARTLGIYHNAVAQARDEYDTFAQVQNLKIDAENKEIEKRNRKAEVETPLKKKYQLSDEMKDYEFLFKEHRFWGTGAQRAQDFSHFGAYNENYFNALYRFAVTANSGKTYKGFGKKYREIFRTRDPVSGKIGYNLSLQGVDVLRCILTDRYPKGACDEKGNPCEDEKIGGTAQDKLEAFKYLFNGKETENRIDQFARLATAQRSLPTQQEEMLQDVNQVYSALFDSNLDDMTKTGSVDLSQSLDKLDENLKRSKEKYLEAVQVHIDAKEAVERITGELVHCKRRMLQLEADVKTATKLKGNAAAGAIAAVNFVEKDYRDIAEGKAARAAVTKDVKNPGEFEVMRKKVFGK